MITEEQQTRVQYESTKESPIVTGDRLPYPYQYTEIEQIYMKLGSRDLINKQDFTVGEAEVTINIDVPIGEMVTIYRRTPLNQGSEFPQESKFSSKKIEDALDKLTLQNIEQQGALDRTIKFAINAPLDVVNVELPLPEAGKTLVWNKEENGLINSKLKVEDIVTGVIDYTKRAETAAENAEASNVSATEQAQIATSKAQEAVDAVTGFDTHVAEKQNAFDINAATLTARYDNNDLAKTNAFNQNAADKQELVDASANAAKLSEENAKKYANGTIEEYPEGSSKYWSEKAKGIVVDSIIDDSVISTEKTYSSNKIEEALKKSGDDKVSKTGNETIEGLKTFKSSAGGSSAIELDNKTNSHGASAIQLMQATSNGYNQFLVRFINGNKYPFTVNQDPNNLDKFDFNFNGKILKSFIYETYAKGSSGYLLYSNGFCMQWGHSASSRVSLLKPYRDNLYNVSATGVPANRGASPTPSNLDIDVGNITTNSFNYYQYNASGQFEADWCTKGYCW